MARQTPVNPGFTIVSGAGTGSNGDRIDVWNGNVLVDIIYARNFDQINKYVKLEREHIAKKQKQAEERNRRRRERAALRLAN